MRAMVWHNIGSSTGKRKGNIGGFLALPYKVNALQPCRVQVWLLLRLLDADRLALVAVLPGVQDAALLQRHPLPRQQPPRHVGGAHEDTPGRQVRHTHRDIVTSSHLS